MDPSTDFDYIYVGGYSFSSDRYHQFVILLIVIIAIILFIILFLVILFTSNQIGKIPPPFPIGNDQFYNNFIEVDDIEGHKIYHSKNEQQLNCIDNCRKNDNCSFSSYDQYNGCIHYSSDITINRKKITGGNVKVYNYNRKKITDRDRVYVADIMYSDYWQTSKNSSHVRLINIGDIIKLDIFPNKAIRSDNVVGYYSDSKFELDDIPHMLRVKNNNEFIHIHEPGEDIINLPQNWKGRSIWVVYLYIDV